MPEPTIVAQTEVGGDTGHQNPARHRQTSCMLQADRSTWTGRGLSVLGGLRWCVVPGWSPNGNVAGESIQATKQSSWVAHTHSAFIFETLAKQKKNPIPRGSFPDQSSKGKVVGWSSGGSGKSRVMRSRVGQLPKLNCRARENE